jgi:phosphatidylglycerophosphatase A
MPKFLTRIISTFCYVGYFPLIPGTAGSLVGLGIYFLLKNNLLSYILVLLVLLVLGFWASTEAEKAFNKKDPSRVVIDEVCGMLLSLLFVPYDIKLVIIGFFIFRLLDTLKPFPVGRLERIPGGLGIMLDDIAAGIYTNLVLQAVVIFSSFKVL